MSKCYNKHKHKPKCMLNKIKIDNQVQHKLILQPKYVYRIPHNNFKFQSSYTLHTPILGPTFTSLVKKINNYVSGVLVYGKGPDGYVPVLETEQAIKDGRLDCAFTGLSYAFVQNSFFEIYTSVPFGIEADAYITYLFEEGGLARLNEQGKKVGLFFYPMSLLPPETGGWFNKEILTVDDFKDIKMRIYGLGRNIIENLGGETVFLPQTAIIPSIKNGTINAVEFSTIEIDAFIGLPDVMSYWYTPSWNQLSTVLYFVINLQKWNKLTKKQQDMIKIMLKENLWDNYVSNNAVQIKYAKQYNSQLKVFPDNVLDGMRLAFYQWLDQTENIAVKKEYARIKAYSVTYKSYKTLMSKGVA